MNVNEIMGLLPHRYRMLLVDRVAEYVPNEPILAYKNITVNEDVFNGHPPCSPIFSGGMTHEALAPSPVVLGSLSPRTPPVACYLSLFPGAGAVLLIFMS